MDLDCQQEKWDKRCFSVLLTTLGIFTNIDLLTKINMRNNSIIYASPTFDDDGNLKRTCQNMD